MAAFRAAIEMGCEGIELDVQLSKKGVPIVVHDSKIGNRRVARMSLSELSQHAIPTLEEVVSLDRGNALLMVELKEGDGGVENLVSHSLAIMQNQENWVIGSLSLEIVDALRQVTDRVIGIADSDHAIEHCLAWQLTLLAIDHQLATKERVEAIRSTGAEVWSWTVDDPAEARQLVSFGVSGIITNDPRAIR